MWSSDSTQHFRMRPWAVAERVAFAVMLGLLTLIAYHWRAFGFDPASLWLDDEWVGVVVRRMSFGDFFRLRPPVPIGFVAVEKLLGQISSDPEWPLQLLPFACGLAQVPLMAILVHAMTERRSLALLAAALVTIGPLSIELAIRVKQYSLDGLAVIALLLLGAPLLTRWHHARAWKFALAAVAALFFSFPSLFISVPLLHLALAWQGLRRAPGERFTTRHTVIVVSFDLAVALAWATLLRGQSSAAMTDYWSAGYLPTDFGGAVSFLRQKGWDAIRTVLPDTLAPALVLLPVGLLDLWLRPRRRGLAVLLFGFYLEMLCVSALRLYPLGGGRTDSFAHPIGIMLLMNGLNRLMAWQRETPAVTVTASGLALALAFGFGAPASYPGSGDAAVIRAAGERVEPGDSLIIYPHATIGVGYYGSWPIRLIPWPDYAHNFHIQILRPDTLSLSPSGNYWDDPACIDREIATFLATPRRRVFYLEASWVHDGPHKLILRRLKKRGYSVRSELDSAASHLLLFTKRAE